VLARALLLVLALAAAGWLASGYPGARDEARAVYGSARTDPPEAIRLLDAARARRPDSTVVPRLAGLLVLSGRPDRAIALLRPLVRAEPDNATAWAVLAIALSRTDPVAARAAQRRRVALVPPVRP
jgi:predicted Zn-dependent protease